MGNFEERRRTLFGKRPPLIVFAQGDTALRVGTLVNRSNVASGSGITGGYIVCRHYNSVSGKLDIRNIDFTNYKKLNFLVYEGPAASVGYGVNGGTAWTACYNYPIVGEVYTFNISSVSGVWQIMLGASQSSGDRSRWKISDIWLE